MPAPEGDRIVPVINELMNKFNIIVVSRDTHPPNSGHFDKWPVHCVRATKGAAFHPDLDITKIEKELLKGTDDKDDGYSAFEATNENLYKYLKNNQVTDVYITGLTTEYCIKNTALDSIHQGFGTYVVTDAIAPVEPDSDNERNALAEMKEKGIILISAKEL